MVTQTQPAGASRVAAHISQGRSSATAVRDARDILWDAIRAKRLSEIAFRRDQVFGSITADYFAPAHHLVISVNDPGVSSKHWLYARQDAQLRHMGFRVLRFTHEEVLCEMPLVLDSIVEVVSQIARRMRKI